MPRRLGLPGASELFRSTAPELSEEMDTARTMGAEPARTNGEHAGSAGVVLRRPVPKVEPDGRVEHTGRIRHDEKITVYVSSEELLALERLRIDLRAEHGLAVDRGRIVRAAIASALAAIDTEGEESDVVRRLASAS